jgi:transposase InsO family protein
VCYLKDAHEMSERHACDLVGIARSTFRYQAVITDDEAELTEKVGDYAHRYPQYGYRLVTGLLQAQGIDVNHKRVERIWRQEGLQQPKRTAYKRRYGKGGDVK